MILSILGVLSAILAIVAYVPYAADIVKRRVRPARSARIMLLLILVFALLQQKSLGSGWALSVIAGELVGSIAILVLALRYGVGGLQKHELVCYGLLGVSLVLWLLTDSPLLALHISVLADLIAFAPTLIKT